MTLLITEFHSDRLVFAADRAITWPQTGKRLQKAAGSQKKIREIPRLAAGIGFYGLAIVGNDRMTDWIEVFLRRRSNLATLGELAQALKKDLESAIPRQHKAGRLGFHLAGYNGDGNPELWHINNTVLQNGRRIGGPTFEVSEDFLRQHAREFYAYQGLDGEVVEISERIMVYRNGDLRGHIYTNEAIDGFMRVFQKEHDFKTIRDPEEYLRFKMEVITFIYKKWSTQHVVGRPIDSFTVRERRQR